MIPAEGGSLCGAVRFTLSAPPRMVGVCHCASCRKHTGAPAAVYVDCKRADVAWIAGAPAWFGSSPGVSRGFCARCGSTLGLQEDRRPDEISLHVGVFDRPQDFPPNGKPSFPEERLPWFLFEG
jgi:hypothetical protein